VSSRTSVAIGEQIPGVKRREKLDILLQRIRDQKNPEQAEHNEKVDSLCNSTISFILLHHHFMVWAELCFGQVGDTARVAIPIGSSIHAPHLTISQVY
jgi:hypothetical protein